MRYAIFSDIHSNLEAFRVALSFLKTQGSDRCIFLGDAIGYGANPNEVVELLRELNPICIGGNHDWAVLGKISTVFFNPAARAAVVWTQQHLQKEYVSFLNFLPLIDEHEEFISVHGSLYEPEEFHYISSSADARHNFGLLDRKICFVGHSHCKGVFMLKNNVISFITDDTAQLKKGAKYIINVGSVGQPRDRDYRSCICMYDTSKKVVTFHRLEYNVEKAAKKIILSGLPPFLGERLYMGF